MAAYDKQFRPLGVTPLTTLDNVKTFLGIPLSNSAQDALINQLIPIISEIIEEKTGRQFGEAIRYEYVSGTGGPYLILAQRPIVQVPIIYELQTGYWGDGPQDFEDDGTALVEGTDYSLVRDGAKDNTGASGLVYRINGVWERPNIHDVGRIKPSVGGPIGNYAVLYSSGYAKIPGPVEYAAMSMFARIRVTKAYGQAVRSIGYENFSVSFGELTQSLYQAAYGSPEIANIMASYREIPVG